MNNFCILLAIALFPGLAAADETGDHVKMVIELLGEKDKDLRALALEQVRGELKGEAATRELAAQLPNLSDEVQVELLGALAERNDGAARPGVLKILDATKSEPVKVAALAALGALGQPDDAPLLVRWLAAPTKPAQSAARASLTRLPGEAAPAAIAAQLGSSSAPVRSVVIEILAARRALGQIPAILTAATDNEPLVRTAAMKALGTLAETEHIPAMMQAVLKAEKGPERDAAERAVAQVCSRIADADSRAQSVLTVLESSSAAERPLLLPLVGRVGGAAALSVVKNAVASPEPALHAAGIRALCNWPDATIAARLIELVESDAHPEHRSLALAALIRIAPLPDERTPAARLDLLKKAMSMCTKDDERNLVIKRARAIRSADSLRFLAPYIEQPAFAQQACESIVELAHHRELREANKAEFHQALDAVMQTSKDATVMLRADRYKKNQTWARPTATETP